MARIEKTVFISYRRTNVPWALAISQYLTHSGYDVFVDYTGVASGDFEAVILDNIKARAHFLVILTPSALERCGDPGDWLRREIETAIDTKRNVVPLMLESFDFGALAIASQLTGKLEVLRQYNGMSVNAEYFDAAMEKLRTKFLNVALDAVIHPASAVAKQVATAQKAAVAAAAPVPEEELTAQQWFERGVNTNDHDEEIRLNTEAIRLKPDYAEAFYNRGLARYNKGDIESAIADYTEAIRLKPQLAEAFSNRGVAYRATGDSAAAIADYDEAIRLKPDYAIAYDNRGTLRKANGDLDGAIADYDQAIRLQPDYANALYNRANARKQKGDRAGAIEDYSSSIRLNPDDGDAFCNRGSALQDYGDLDAALADYHEAIRLQPNDPANFNNRGVALKEKGDLDSALADYNEALRLKPDYQLAINNREEVLGLIADRSKS